MHASKHYHLLDFVVFNLWVVTPLGVNIRYLVYQIFIMIPNGNKIAVMRKQ